MNKTEAAAIDGEIVNDNAPSAESREVAAPRARGRAVAAGGAGGGSPPDPMELYKIALQKGASVEVMNQLLQLQERVEAMSARKAFNAAISAARAELPVIVKNARVNYDAKQSNGKVDYVHETLAQIAAQIDPILARHGLSYRFRPGQPAPGQLSVTCVISHELGHSEENTLAAGVDVGAGKNHLQAIGSATTYLSRYTLKAALGLSAAEHDDDASSVQDAPRPRPSVPRASQSGGGGNGAATQQTAASGKPRPHKIEPKGAPPSEWALVYIKAIKTADTIAELEAWDKANDGLLEEVFKRAEPVYREINAAYRAHRTTLEQKADPGPQRSRHDDPISSGPIDPPAEKPAPKWVHPDPKTDYESFLSWATDKLRSWVAEFGDIEEFWNEVIEPGMQGAFPTDKDDLMSEYRRAEHRLGG